MKYCFIINPASGKENTKEGLEAKIRDAADKAEVELTVMYTEAAGDMQKYIKNFWSENSDDRIRFYVCGGDGTICEAVNGIMAIDEQYRDNVSLGVVPVGTGNDFVRNFKDNELFFDFDAQMKASPEKIDLLKCNDMYAANMINIGFDCQVVVKASEMRRNKLVPSKFAYMLGVLATVVKMPGVAPRVSKDGGKFEQKQLLLTTYANGSFCGGGFHSNPNASIKSGNINSLCINKIGRLKLIQIIGDYKKGTHLVPKFEKIISEENASEYVLEFDKPTNVSVDGEILTLEKLEISCAKAALNLLLPAGVALAGAEKCVEDKQTVGV